MPLARQLDPSPIFAISLFQSGSEEMPFLPGVLLRRKKMQGFEVEKYLLNLTNQAQPVAENENIRQGVTDLFNRLHRDGIVYCVQDSGKKSYWYLHLKKAAQSLKSGIEHNELSFTDERRRKYYDDWHRNLSDHRISDAFSPSQKNPLPEDDPDSLCAGLSPWFYAALRFIVRLESGAQLPLTLSAASSDVRFGDLMALTALGRHLLGKMPAQELLIFDRNRSFLPEPITGAFLNKLRNAARFVQLNIREGDNLNPENLGDADKWILHGLNNLVDTVNDLIDRCNVDKAAYRLYEFFRYRFCGWYLPLAKVDIENPGTRSTLLYTFHTYLRLLYPFLPETADEIYRDLPGGWEKSLADAAYPGFSSQWVFSRAWNRVDILLKVVKRVRRIRSENQIPAARPIDILLKSGSDKEQAMLERNMEYFKHLTGSLNCRITTDFAGAAKGFMGDCLNWTIRLPINNPQEATDHINRLQREAEQVDRGIKQLEQELTAGMETAHETTENKKKLQQLNNRRDKIHKTLLALK